MSVFVVPPAPARIGNETKQQLREQLFGELALHDLHHEQELMKNMHAQRVQLSEQQCKQPSIAFLDMFGLPQPAVNLANFKSPFIVPPSIVPPVSYFTTNSNYNMGLYPAFNPSLSFAAAAAAAAFAPPQLTLADVMAGPAVKRERLDSAASIMSALSASSDASAASFLGNSDNFALPEPTTMETLLANLQHSSTLYPNLCNAFPVVLRPTSSLSSCTESRDVSSSASTLSSAGASPAPVVVSDSSRKRRASFDDEDQLFDSDGFNAGETFTLSSLIASAATSAGPVTPERLAHCLHDPLPPMPVPASQSVGNRVSRIDPNVDNVTAARRKKEREAKAASRQKQRDLMNDLERTNALLDQEHAELKQRVLSLQSQLTMLRGLVQAL
ncbi:hypothetical protein CAOG_01903 [Capsaspora owczarzaki ATCC 30864]|uniref:BZIP domain-containing protein n=1 Tax=Capsaspora owczarzaki (strain ATCC 30864) TaxID=595528 RepID=A0A0D2X1D5_CAPO3|nr:hypothetical protein CAOG_01903 [Capsaspora owczarzaki ATCC 30864]KJE90619.1 hypothetical protein CAOG_001903 [Capsaspora owczarzaki ATCC 30864]|eukprot:XP_004364771.1 hypothetical protein CAOG_01903 [Capsaspora owczarzaki ATCC 30864]